eukprot:63426-Pyramimonas_sp.AAC.1
MLAGKQRPASGREVHPQYLDADPSPAAVRGFARVRGQPPRRLRRPWDIRSAFAHFRRRQWRS